MVRLYIFYYMNNVPGRFRVFDGAASVYRGRGCMREARSEAIAAFFSGDISGFCCAGLFAGS